MTCGLKLIFIKIVLQFTVSTKLSYCKIKLQCLLFCEVFSASLIQLIALSSVLPKHFINTFAVFVFNTVLQNLCSNHLCIRLSHYIVMPHPCITTQCFGKSMHSINVWWINEYHILSQAKWRRAMQKGNILSIKDYRWIQGPYSLFQRFKAHYFRKIMAPISLNVAAHCPFIMK